MLTIIGLIVIVSIVVLLLLEKISPVVSMVLIPLIGAFVAGFNFQQISEFYTLGVTSVIQIVIMFIFAILFFGLMSDTGLFDPVIKKMIAITRGNVIAVAVGTVIIAALAQLDGSGATTFLIVVPPLLSLYKRLNMSPYLLLLLVAASAGLINALPWGGPLGRVATVIQQDVVEIWRPLIPLQIIGIVLLLILAIFLGFREKRRIIIALNEGKDYYNQSSKDIVDYKDLSINTDPNEIAIMQKIQAMDEEKKKALLRPKLIWFNAILFICMVGFLMSGLFKPAYVFMIAFSIAIVVNYPNPKQQIERISAHAGGAIMMASIILAAGTFLGIIKTSGMLESIAIDISSILPSGLRDKLHLFVGFLGVPFELLLSTDAYYFGLFPVVEQITSNENVPAASSGYALLIGSIVGTFISPFSPALWMGLGLAKLAMGRHIRYSFFIIWIYSLILLVIAYFLGLI